MAAVSAACGLLSAPHAALRHEVSSGETKKCEPTEREVGASERSTRRRRLQKKKNARSRRRRDAMPQKRREEVRVKRA